MDDPYSEVRHAVRFVEEHMTRRGKPYLPSVLDVVSEWGIDPSRAANLIRETAEIIVAGKRVPGIMSGSDTLQAARDAIPEIYRPEFVTYLAGRMGAF